MPPSERRSARRYQFIAEAEISERESGATLKAKTGDLSTGGCFIDMLNPPPQGKEVGIRIFWKGTQFSALGRVVFVFPNLGMGVMFTSVAADQRSVLCEWLADLSGSPGVSAVVGQRGLT